MNPQIRSPEPPSSRNLGQQTEKIDSQQGIKLYEEALTALIPTASPMEWAETMRCLGDAYANCLRGDRGENLEKAIQSYQNALQVITLESTPIQWAETMRCLGDAYANRLWEDRGENLEKAIQSYQNALAVYTKRENQKNEDSFGDAVATYENAMSIAKTIVAKLIDFLSAKDAQFRIEAALALGKIGDENAVPALCDILATDRDAEVRRSAAQALGMIGSIEEQE